MIHLDTNFLIALSQSSPLESQRVSQWVTKGEELAVSTIAWAEFLCGPITPGAAMTSARVVGTPLPFLPADAVTCARLFNATGRRRNSIVDCMIAAIALRSDAAVATNDTSHFERFAELGVRLAT